MSPPVPAPRLRPLPGRRRVLETLGAVGLATVARTGGLAALPLALGACAAGGYGDENYRPRLGQPGKDVMWAPTLDSLLVTMLERAQLGPSDVLYDLGSGDGKIIIEAARRHGIRAVGIEYDARLAALAERNARRAGVERLARTIHGDIFKEDFSEATVVTLYLGRELNLRLKPRLLAMRPGTRIISNTFDMGIWQPDELVRHESGNNVYVWIIPARLEGRWRIEGGGSVGLLNLRQSFQKLEGVLTRTGAVPLKLEGSIHHDRFTLVELAAAGSLERPDRRATQRTIQGRLQGGRLELVLADGARLSLIREQS